MSLPASEFMIAVGLPCIGLFFGVLVMLELGRRLRARHGPRETGVGAIEASLLALMGLLIAFSFSGAMSRFEARRQLVVEEANDIGTAWLRLDALPESAQPALRAQLRAYVDARLAIYHNMGDAAAMRAALGQAESIQREIWTLAVQAVRTPDGQRAIMLVLPALNEMFDVTTKRTAASLFHTPAVVFWMLGTVVLIASFIAGYNLVAERESTYVHRLVFALVAAITVYVILDIEHGRRGLIRLDAADVLLTQLREEMVAPR